ncbi:nuclease P1 [Xylariomycetidae sp. FL0641]|nr:nuclease P1 [Xylariomycetidae sp. FL0641]
MLGLKCRPVSGFGSLTAAPTMRISQLAAAGALFGPALAWNKDVHQQIGYMADKLVAVGTREVMAQLLPAESQGQLGEVAAQPDDFKHTDAGAYSEQWHWIDSSDGPPGYCNVYYNRDCTSGGCVVSAIANQTTILQGCIARVKAGQLRNGEDGVCAQATMFLAHFLGDVTQPLHASGVAAGGNDYPVTFDGEETELHAVWDGDILYHAANVSGFSNTSISPFFDAIVGDIRADMFPEPTAAWTTCVDPSTPVDCALAWARDANAWTCDYVYSQVYNGTDLATSGYADGAAPIARLQTAKAALRLASWMDALVEGRYNTGRQVILGTNPGWNED